MATPQSRCCRVIHRRLRSPCDSTWMSESALASAFGQFCSVSRVTSRRNGSNVPGPLEGRKRMGKRHMGELNFGHMNAPPPFWEIANAVDLTQWKWTAPTSFENRHSRGDGGETRPFFATLQNWLHSASDPSNSPVDGGYPEMLAMGAVAPEISSNGVRTIERVTTAPVRQMPSELLDDIFGDVDALTARGTRAMKSKITGGRSSSKTVALEKFCNELTMATARETISRDTLLIFLSRITQEAYSLESSPGEAVSGRDASSLLIAVYTAIVDGLSVDSGMRVEDRPHTQHFDHYHRVYATLLDLVAQLELNSLRLFQRIMGDIPADGVWRCQHEIASNIHSFLIALSRPRNPMMASRRVFESKGRENVIRQINKMAGCLNYLSSDTVFHRDILEMTTESLSARQETASSQYTALECELIRFCWLHLLSRLPLVGTEYLARACNLLDTNSAATPLTQRQICEIFLAKINSRYSVKEVTGLYESLRASPESSCYATVSGKLWRSGQQRYVKRLADLLQQTGRQQDMKYIVHGLRSLVQNESRPLANLALGLGHPQLALWVYIRYHQSRWKSKKFWNTAFAQETLDKLLESQELKSERVLDALRIYPTRQRKRGRFQVLSDNLDTVPQIGSLQVRQKPRKSILPQRRVQQTEKVASALARARHLTDRMALARITQCINFLQSHNHPISPKVLRALFQIVTRDLAAGNPGRTSRLKWFLGLLLKETDTSDVLAVGHALEQWRSLLYPDE